MTQHQPDKSVDAADAAGEILVGVGEKTRRIAYRKRDGRAPTLVWLGGYRSDMRGTKAEFLLDFAVQHQLGFCRFDYSGHGESGGTFEEGTIGRWSAEAAAVLQSLDADNPVILAGSSMGAWIALNLIRRAQSFGIETKIAGLLLLAPAPDFTERLILPKLDAAQRASIETAGRLETPSQYAAEPDIYTRDLFEDGRANLVLDGPIETHCPVSIIQGMADDDVPYEHALTLVEHLPQSAVTLSLVKDGDHRLSRPQDLTLIGRILADLVEAAGKMA
ncbi:alpha/beta hydrolase [Jiella sp. MQZ9-1]|uniref:Palmitoyl-protein thioesterase ABHD10, mitochondrial n=1 Tax=Jiella flava TaxID=2816857 RepID=A0A939G0R4_9HYPH|nr:alpha/beta hydrolase [Jiella flava]MBO0664374.1 alpha/beta hydrolase [Jiella flava]MCD2473009.1 alpha/beta hydrolase [Jiella flava]